MGVTVNVFVPLGATPTVPEGVIATELKVTGAVDTVTDAVPTGFAPPYDAVTLTEPLPAAVPDVKVTDAPVPVMVPRLEGPTLQV